MTTVLCSVFYTTITSNTHLHLPPQPATPDTPAGTDASATAKRPDGSANPAPPPRPKRPSEEASIAAAAAAAAATSITKPPPPAKPKPAIPPKVSTIFLSCHASKPSLYFTPDYFFHRLEERPPPMAHPRPCPCMRSRQRRTHRHRCANQLQPQPQPQPQPQQPQSPPRRP